MLIRTYTDDLDNAQDYSDKGDLATDVTSTTSTPAPIKKKVVGTIDTSLIGENLTMVTNATPQEDQAVTEKIVHSNSSNNILKMMFNS